MSPIWQPKIHCFRNTLIFLVPKISIVLFFQEQILFCTSLRQIFGLLVLTEANLDLGISAAEIHFCCQYLTRQLLQLHPLSPTLNPYRQHERFFECFLRSGIKRAIWEGCSKYKEIRHIQTVHFCRPGANKQASKLGKKGHWEFVSIYCSSHVQCQCRLCRPITMKTKASWSWFSWWRLEGR